MRDIYNIIFIIIIIIIDLIFIFSKTRKNEKISGDDQSTPEIIENRYGNYCKDCGNSIDAKHTYCDYCGKKVR